MLLERSGYSPGSRLEYKHDTLDTVVDHFGVGQVALLSGTRHPKIRRKGHLYWDALQRVLRLWTLHILDHVLEKDLRLLVGRRGELTLNEIGPVELLHLFSTP